MEELRERPYVAIAVLLTSVPEFPPPRSFNP
jgi:hypothetical protein